MTNKKTYIVVLILFMLFVSVAVPMTYARYKNENDATGEVKVAKWDIKVNGKSIDEELIIDLFNSVENVSDTTTNYIMPGSQGSFDLKIENESDVTALVSISLEEVLNNKNIPIVYSLTEQGEYKDDKDFIIANDEEVVFGEINNIKNYKIYWQWPFYSDDNLVINSNEKLKVKVNIKVSQNIDK